MYRKLLPLALLCVPVFADDDDSLPFVIVNSASGETHDGTYWGVNNAGAVVPSSTGVRFVVNDDGELEGNDEEVEVTSNGFLTLRDDNDENEGFSLTDDDPPVLLLNRQTPTVWICGSDDDARIALGSQSPQDDCVEYSIEVQLQGGSRSGSNTRTSSRTTGTSATSATSGTSATGTTTGSTSTATDGAHKLVGGLSGLAGGVAIALLI
ncbi:hypothetical protein LJB42_000923 [Komagataella kurtzmanii]|nr:hypothetical protein LJB42_000923 [Komagataella kurtzmanii]